jgi:uncharacterized protein involved in exopolysaccharide biosynthesis
MEERTLFDYWMVLYRRRWIILTVVLFALFMSLFLSWQLPPIYEARALFFVPKQPDAAIFFSGDAQKTLPRTVLFPASREEENAAYIGILKSDALAMRVKQEFPLKHLQDLAKNVDVELSNEFMLQVFVRDRDPQLAADIANAYFRHLNRSMQLFSDNPTGRNKQAIEAQLTETNHNLAMSRKALAEFQAGKGIGDLSQQTSELVKQKSSFETTLENTRLSLSETGKRIASTQQQLTREASLYIPTELVTSNPFVESLKRDLADLEAAVTGQLTEVSERHPELLKLRAQYEAKRRELAQEIDKITKSRAKPQGSFYEDLRRSLTNLLVDKEASEAKVLGLQRTIAGIETELAKLPEVKAKHDELTQGVAVQQKLVELLLTTLEEARIQEKRQMQPAVLVDPARPPDGPAFPIVWLNAIAAVGVSFIGSILYCFLLDYIERVRMTMRIRRSVASGMMVEGL